MSLARAIGSAVALFLACLLGPLALIGHWADRTVADTDTYVDTVAPLAEEPAIQEAVATQVSTAIMNALDDAQLLDKLIDAAFADRSLPPVLENLLRTAIGSVRSQVEARVERAANRLTSSNAFAESWRSANEVAHSQLVAALSGDLAGIDSSGSVTIELAAIIDAVKDILIDQGFDLVAQLPEVNASFPVADVEQLETIGQTYDVMHRWVGRLTIGFFAALIIGLALAQHRRRALVRVTIGGIAVLALVLTAIAYARGAAVDALPPSAPKQAAAAAVEILTDPLRSDVRAAAWLLLAILAVVGIVTLATGKGARATTLRRRIKALLEQAQERWGDALWPPLVGGAAAVLGVILLLALTPGPLVSMLLLALILLGSSMVAVLTRDVDGETNAGADPVNPVNPVNPADPVDSGSLAGSDS